MKDLSLYILDIAMNSVRAGAALIEISLCRRDEWLDMTVKDNGCGMTPAQVERLSDPFFTTRTTRKVGLGIPFLRMLAEQTGGYVTVESKPESEGDGHGTTVFARFTAEHIDFIPLGDVTETILTLIQGSPETDFVFSHTAPGLQVQLDTREMRQVLGGDIPLSSYEVLAFIKQYLLEQYNNN